MTLVRMVNTGLDGLYQSIDFLRPGDNAVWKVKFTTDYKRMVAPFAELKRFISTQRRCWEFIESVCPG